MRKHFKNKKTILIVLAALLLIPSSVLAGRTVKRNVYVGADQIIDGNFLGAGDLVLIEGVVNGDVIVAGGSVIINGAVAGDVIAAGGQIRVNGPVQGDIRLLGGDVQVQGVVGRNATILGGNVELNRESAIGWGAIILAGNVDILGTIKKELRAIARTLKLNGSIGENVWVKVGEENQFILQSQAWVGGDLHYSAPTSATILSGATIHGEVDYDPIRRDRVGGAIIGSALLIAWFTFKLILYISFLIFGLLALWIIPKHIQKVNKEIKDDFWTSFAKGIVAAVAVPIISVALLFTVIGWPIGLFALAVYGIGILYSVVLMSVFLGELVLRKFTGRKWRSVSQRWSLALGLFLHLLISAIPIVGPLACALLVLTAFGALLTVDIKALKRYR